MTDENSSLRDLRSENERLRQEVASLRKQHNRLPDGRQMSNLADLIPVGVTIFQHDRIVYANKAAFAGAGLEAGDANLDRLLDCLAPDDLIHVKKKAAARHAGDPEVPHEYELPYRTTQGEKRWALTKVTLIQYDGAPATLSVSVDVTERKQVEVQLAVSQANLRAILESTSDFILLSDRNARPVYFNSAYAAVMKELLGIDMRPGLQPHTLLPDPQARAQWEGYHRRALSGERFFVEFTLPISETEDRYFEHSFYPVCDNGDVVGFCEFTRETTERRRQEAAFRNVQQEQNRQLQRVAGGLAHEIFNAVFPASAALLKLRERLERSARRTGDDYLRSLDLAQRSLTRTIELTESVRLFSRIEQLKTDEPVNLHELVDEIVQLHRVQFDDAGITADTAVAKGLLVLCPRPHLYSVIDNLVANAMAAVSDGKTRRILIEAQRESGMALIRVRDTGRGIASEHLDQIFQPFFTTRPGRGSGLGLAIVKRVVDLSGGSIEIHTAPGDGTTFELRLPSAAPSD